MPGSTPTQRRVVLAVRIRLRKTGRRHVNAFRIVVTDVRKAQGGDVLERVGSYLPEFPDPDKQLTVDAERVTHWLSVGAQPSVTVASLLRRAGVQLPKKTGKKSPTKSADKDK